MSKPTSSGWKRAETEGLYERTWSRPGGGKLAYALTGPRPDPQVCPKSKPFLWTAEYGKRFKRGCGTTQDEAKRDAAQWVNDLITWSG